MVGTYGGYLMTAIGHVHIFFRCQFKIFLLYNYDMLYCVFLLMHVFMMWVRFLL